MSTADGRSIHLIILQGVPHVYCRLKFDTSIRVARGSPCLLPTEIRYTVLHCVILTHVYYRRKLDTPYRIAGVLQTEMRYGRQKCHKIYRIATGSPFAFPDGNSLRGIGLQPVPHLYYRQKITTPFQSA